LKDASASAIYGANGSNGVIIITTKRGKAGKPQVSFNSYMSLNLAPEKYNVMDAQQYSDFYSENLYKINGLGKTYTDLTTNKVVTNPAYPFSSEFRQNYYGQGWEKGTDWQDLLTKNGLSQNYNLSVAGGGESSNFHLSFGYSKEDGTIIKNSYERFHIRANSDFKLSKYIKIGENLSSNYGIGETPIPTMANVWNLDTSPLMKVYNSSILGGYESYQTQYWVNTDNSLTQISNGGASYLNTVMNDKPNLLVGPMKGSNMAYSFNTAASIYAQIDFTPWLMYKVTTSAEMMYNRTKYWLPQYGLNRFVGGSKLRETYSESVDLNLENLLMFKKNFNDTHNVQATVVYTTRAKQVNIIGVSEDTFDYETLNTLSNGYTATNPATPSGSLAELRMISYLGRVMYDYKGKYFLTGSYRSDGISLFGPGHQRGDFWSGSLAWKINDDFLKNIKEIDQLKMRLGWGQTGNSNVGAAFQYLNTISGKVDFKPVFGDNQQIASAQYAFGQKGNPDFEWEKAEMINAGFDLSMFNSKLQVNAEYYIKNNFNLLYQVDMSASLGFNTGGSKPWYNIADIQNKGIEVSVQWRDKIGDFNYGVISNFTTIKNEVTSLPNSSLTSAYNRTIVGQPIGSLYGYVSEGIIQLDENYFVKGTNGDWQYKDGLLTGYKYGQQEGKTPQPGDIKYKDLDGNGNIDAYDKTIIGKTIPSFTYTLSFDCSYKSFDFNMFLFGVADYQIYNQQRASLSVGNSLGHNKLVEYAENHWTTDNPSTSYVRFDKDNFNLNDKISTFWTEDGSFLRIKEVQVGYTLPAKFNKKLGIASLRLYVNASNLYCFTKYKGRDPEGFMSSTPTSSGVDNGDFSVPQSYSCGLQIGF